MTRRFEVRQGEDHGRGRWIVYDLEADKPISEHRNEESAERKRDRLERKYRYPKES